MISIDFYLFVLTSGKSFLYIPLLHLCQFCFLLLITLYIYSSLLTAVHVLAIKTLLGKKI